MKCVNCKLLKQEISYGLTLAKPLRASDQENWR